MTAGVARAVSVALFSLLINGLAQPMARAQTTVDQDKVHHAKGAVAIALVDALLPVIPQATDDDRAVLARLLHGTGTAPDPTAFKIDVNGIDCRYQTGNPGETECWVAVGAAPLISVKGAKARTIISALLKAGIVEDTAMGRHQEAKMNALTCTINDRSAQGAKPPGAAPVACRFTDPMGD